MKIIISHDIDHITVYEHFTDFIIPKFLIRNFIELVNFKISVTEYFLRFFKLFTNKWQNIKEIIQFNKENNIPATFFIGVNNGLGLNYKLKEAEKWIKYIVNQNVECGVHGISYQKQNEIDKEFSTFKNISGLEDFGIRMHYLRTDKKTLEMLSKAGYSFDSTVYEEKNPYLINNMVEFPLQIMESYEMEGKKRWQSRSSQEAINNTIKKIENYKMLEIKYLTILFHDRYFDNSFKSWKKWYIEIIKYCKANNYEFISYKNAIKEIKSS